MPAPLMIAGGVMAGAGLLGSLLSAPKARSADSFRLGGMGGLGQLSSQMADPRYGLADFQRQAQDAAPSLADVIAMNGGRGGVMAREQFEQYQRQAQQGGFDAFSRYRMGKDGQRASVLETIMRGQQWQNQMAQQTRDNRSQYFGSLFNSLASGGMGMLGQGMGGG